MKQKLYILLLVTMISAGVGTVLATSPEQGADAVEPNAFGEGNADATLAGLFEDSACAARLGIAAPELKALTPCEIQCIRNEVQCDMFCDDTCDSGPGDPFDPNCYAQCEANCAWAGNLCMCDCGSPHCIP